MKSMSRNKSSFKYLTYKGKTELKDSDNYSTGEYVITYNAPVSYKAPISANKGQDFMEMFGVAQDYDKVITIDDVNLSVDENTMFFIDKDPVYDSTNETLSNKDYIVSKIAKSLNVLVILVKKVRTDEN